MTASRVLMLEAAGPESSAVAAAAIARGYQVHAATHADQHATCSPGLRHLLSGCVLTNFSRSEQALEDVVGYAHRIRADAVVTTNEYLTPLLAEICNALDLPGNDPALANTARNKADMSRQFAQRGVSTPRTYVLGHEDELRRLCSTGQLTFPCVIKPTEGAGSAGVTVTRTAHGAVAAFRAAREQRGMYETALDPRVLVQEYVAGTEYSVESFTQNGTSTHLCLTRKTVTSGAHRVELGHDLPEFLPPDVERAAYAEVDKAIAAVGIRNGASHTEVMLTAEGNCTVIEIGARIGAGQIGFLIHHALGIDPWTACLDTAMGRPAQLAPTHRGYALVRFLTSPSPGRIVAVTGLPRRSAQVPIVHMRKAVGDSVSDARRNGERLGYFVVVGRDAAAVARHADDLLERVHINVGADSSNP